MLHRQQFITGLLVIITSMVHAQQSPILLFPGGAPGETSRLDERAGADGGTTGGKTVLRISNVGEPTITIYPAPEDYASGSAVIVCPGGAYNILAYDLEGDEVCEWLNQLGVTAVLLKYRVPRREGREKHEAPLQDVQRAISYIRANAAKYDIDPARIGVIGFSAGAHLAATASNRDGKRSYPATDAADNTSCQPDFCMLIYPAYLDSAPFTVAPEVTPNAATPATFIVQTEDDKTYINSSLFYYYALKEADVPAEMHLYSDGGHDYGLRDTGATVNEWPDRAEEWLRGLGIIE